MAYRQGITGSVAFGATTLTATDIQDGGESVEMFDATVLGDTVVKKQAAEIIDRGSVTAEVLADSADTLSTTFAPGTTADLALTYPAGGDRDGEASVESLSRPIAIGALVAATIVFTWTGNPVTP